MLLEKRTLFLLFSFLWFLSLIQASAFAQTSNEKVRGDRLVISDLRRLAPINPVLTSTTLSTKLIDVIYDGLIELDQQLVPRPHLAQSWIQSQDGLVWTFHIRKGVKFHDGHELTAEDVAFTFKAIKEQKGGQPWSYVFEEIDQITVLEPYVLQVTLKKPFAAFLQALFIGILPKHLLRERNLTQSIPTDEIIGTGPYLLKSWSEQKATLKAFDNYFLGKPYINEIHVDIYPNQKAIWAKFMAEEVDYFEYFTPKTFEILKQVPSFNLYTIEKPYYYLVAFNQKAPIFKDKKIRQALNYAINKEEIITRVLMSQGRVMAGTIFPDSWAFNPKVSPYSYNPHKALKLLNEAGWKDHDGDHLLDKEGKPFHFTIHINTGDELKKQTILLLQQQLLDIGIQLDAIFFDVADTSFIFKKQFQSFLVEMLAIPDPDMSYLFWHSSQTEGGFNVFSYQNPEVDKFLENGRAELDPSKRKTIYFDYQEEMHQDPPGTFLFWTQGLVGVHKRFKGVKLGQILSFKNIREWYVPKNE